MKIIEIYCDGSGTTWDKCAGYGFVLVVDGEFHSEGHGHIPQGTNNDAEMAAAIKGMMAAQALIKDLHKEHYDEYGTDDGFFPYLSVKLRSDSQLCLGWATGRYKHKSEDRQKTVALLQVLFKQLRCEASWIKGHSKHEWNDRADALAHYGRTGEFKRKKDKKSIVSST